MNRYWRRISRAAWIPLCFLLLGSNGALARGQKAKWQYSGKFVVTRYTSDARCCGKWADGYTYTGVPARYGVVAVDPKVIPLGSSLRIEGFDNVVFKAEDIGGAIKGRTIDIWHYNYKYCRQWGKQVRKVWVSRPVEKAEGPLEAVGQLGEAIVSVPVFLLKGIGGLIEAVIG